MTIRQLYYTSCREGRDGIRGFQVNAASPGLAQRHEDLGLRMSAYRPSPSAPTSPTPEQIEGFPVAVGYRLVDDAAILFHSRYIGTDFTGRQGNYFAHVLVLDAPGQDLNGMLPIEAWKSALWTWQPAQGTTELPLVDAIPPGPLADREQVRATLLDGRLDEFGALLSAVQEGLCGRVNRVVVVAPDSARVAHALAAVTWSLPLSLTAAVSFTTFTSSPADAEVLVVGATPDVAVAASPYGDQIVIPLGTDGAGSTSGTSRYATVLLSAWTRGVAAVTRVVELGSGVSPPLQAPELNLFADLAELVELAEPVSPDKTADSADSVRDPLPAVEFALQRLPAVLTPTLWQRVCQWARQTDSLAEVQGWSEVFVAASRGGAAPDPELESEYLRAALSQIATNDLDPASVWLPNLRDDRRAQLAVEWARRTVTASPQLPTAHGVLGALDRLGVALPEADLRSLVDEVVLPVLLDQNRPDAPAQIHRLPTAERLLPLVCAQLEQRLGRAELFDMVVMELSEAAAELFDSIAPGGSRCALAATLAQARSSRTNRVSVLIRAIGRDHGSAVVVQRFAALLWPEPPTAEEGVQLCRRLDAAVLSKTDLPDQLLTRLIDDAQGTGLSTAHEQLAELLTARPLADSLGLAVNTAHCIRLGGYFNSSPKPSPKAAAMAVDAVTRTTGVAVAVAQWTCRVIATWLLTRADPDCHGQVLVEIVEQEAAAEFFAVYRAELARVLSKGKPAQIAAVLPAIVSLADQHTAGKRLLSTTCRQALARRSKRTLDSVGRLLEDNKRRLYLPPANAAGTAGNWASWWQYWRQRNLPKSTLARLFARRRTAEED